MRHTVNLFFIGAIMSIAMFTACKDDKVSDPSSLTVDHTEIDVLSIGGKTLINVNTDLTWNATVDADWVKIAPVSGNGSEIVNVEIDKHLGLRRTAKISFTTSAITKTVDILQRGQDTAKYLKDRENRKVKQTYLEGTTAKVTWGDVTPQSVVSELEYETLSGEWRKVIVTSLDTDIECPNAKPGVKYRMRSGFTPPASLDTLYKGWITSKFPFLTIPTGTLTVDPLSYRYSVASGEPTASIPQPEYSSSNTVTFECIEEGAYKISDLFGGFYLPGRSAQGGYNEDQHICWGTLNYDGTGFALDEFKIDGWGYGWSKVEGETQSTTITLDTHWGTSGYAFHLILRKQ
jgi:hypothetical protein